jgi:hypothetical protein
MSEHSERQARRGGGVMVKLDKGARVEAKLPKDAQNGQYMSLYFGPVVVWVRRDDAVQLAKQIISLSETTSGPSL